MNKNSNHNIDIALSSRQKTPISTAAGYLCFPAILVAALWFGINTSPGQLTRSPNNLLQLTHTIRSAFPLAVLPLAIGYILFVRPTPDPDRRLPGPLRLWAFFGVISLLASLRLSPRGLLHGMYWDIAYLGVIAVMAAYLHKGKDPLHEAVRVNHISWLINTLFLIAIFIFLRDTLARMPSGYSVHTEVSTIAGGMATPRSSGVSRFAAVPGIIGFVMFMRSRGLKKILGIAMFLPSAWLLFFMQSRGAMFAFLFTLPFTLLLLGRKSRLVLTCTIVLGLSAFMLESVPEQWINHITRGSGWEDLRTMTERTSTWKKALPVIWESPLWGSGSRADRILLKGRGVEPHVHNSYLYALLAGGFVGAGLFIAGFVWVWLQVFRIMRSGLPGSIGHDVFFAQVGGILAFFTVRSIPEVSGPLFAVDVMVMMPAMLYISVLYRRMWTGTERRTDRRMWNVEGGT